MSYIALGNTKESAEMHHTIFFIRSKSSSPLLSYSPASGSLSRGVDLKGDLEPGVIRAPLLAKSLEVLGLELGDFLPGGTRWCLERRQCTLAILDVEPVPVVVLMSVCACVHIYWGEK